MILEKEVSGFWSLRQNTICEFREKRRIPKEILQL